MIKVLLNLHTQSTPSPHPVLCDESFSLSNPATFLRRSIMVINFDDFVKNTESVVHDVLEFLELDSKIYTYKNLPAGMKVIQTRCGVGRVSYRHTYITL